MLPACVQYFVYSCTDCVLCAFCLSCVSASSSPCGSLIGDLQTVQVGLRPAAASLLLLVDVARQEGPRRVAVRGMPLAVMVRVPLIG